MTDIDRLIIGIVGFVISYFVFLSFMRRRFDGKETYPDRLSKLSGEDHFKAPANNLDENLNLKYEEAMLLYDAKNFEAAIAKLTECISETRFSEFYYYRGICNFAIKEYQSAINDWETAIILFPEYEYELSSNINEARNNLKK